MSPTMKRIMGTGCILAMILSWTVNYSILWAMVCGMFSWFYVIYYLFVC